MRYGIFEKSIDEESGVMSYRAFRNCLDETFFVEVVAESIEEAADKAAEYLSAFYKELYGIEGGPGAVTAGIPRYFVAKFGGPGIGMRFHIDSFSPIGVRRRNQR